MNNAALSRSRVYQDAARTLPATTRPIFAALAGMPGIQSEMTRAANERGIKREDDQVRHDAQSLVLAARQIEHVTELLYEEPVPQFPMADGQVVDIDTSVPIGAGSFTWYGVSGIGIAEFIGGWAGGSMPMVSLSGYSKNQPLHPFGLGYHYSLDDMRKAMFADFPLDAQYGRAVREGHAKRQHLIGLWGREDLGLPGLIKHPGINVVDAPADGTGSSRYWANKTADLILRDIHTLVTTTSTVSYGRRQTSHVGLPRAEYDRLNAMRMGANGDTVTVMDFLKKIYPAITWFVLDDLAAPLSAGNLAADAAIAYVRDPRIVQLVIPMAFLQHPPQQIELIIKVPCESKSGGITLKEPPTVTRMDSIGLTVL